MIYTSNMKSRAYEALVDRGLLAVVPSFNISSIVDVRPRKISIVVPVNTLASQMDGSDQSFETMLWETERLGHMTASVSAQLHDEMTFLDPLALVHSSFHRPQIPERGDTIYVTSESVMWEDGRRCATFEIVVVTPVSKKIVGFGSDVLQVEEVHESWRARQNGTEDRPSTPTSSEADTGREAAVEEQGSRGPGASETPSSNGPIDSNLNGPSETMSPGRPREMDTPIVVEQTVPPVSVIEEPSLNSLTPSHNPNDSMTGMSPALLSTEASSLANSENTNGTTSSNDPGITIDTLSRVFQPVPEIEVSRNSTLTEDLLLSPRASSPPPQTLVTAPESDEQIHFGPFVTTRRGSGSRHHPYSRPQAPIRREVPVIKSFTFVNVNDTSVISRLQRDLTKLGIRGSNFKSFPMPTSADEHMFVTFTITGESELREMEKLLRNRNWQQHYSICSLMTSWPFFAIHHTPKTLMKAIILASTKHIKPTTMAEQLPSMLTDKMLMKRSLEDVTAIAEIKKSLSEDGMTMLDEISEEFTTRRNSCRF